MRWAARLLRGFTPSARPVRRKVRLGLEPLGERVVPDAAAAHVPNAPFPQVGDRVWRDLNGNGAQDPGEPGIPSVTLQLYRGSNLVGTTVTDGLGNYAFNRWDVTNATVDTADDGLTAGTAYQIRVAAGQQALSGLRLATANAGTDDQRDSDAVAGAGGATLDFTMGPDELYSHYDLGYTAAASIGSVVWGDTNNNGVKDLTETGLSGVTVRLLDPTGTKEVATTTTGADGSYLFDGLVPGTYIVEVAKGNWAGGSALYGWASSTGRSGATGGPFEGAAVPDPNSGKAGVCDHGTALAGAVRCKPVVVLGDSLTNQAAAFGFFRPGTLAGKVYVDVNANGRMDYEDTAGLAGVKLTAAGPAGVFTATTDAAGSYAFANLPAGTYMVTEAQPGKYKSSTPNLVTATVAPAAPAAANFGEVRTSDLAVSLSAKGSGVGLGGIIILTYRVRNVATQDATGVSLLAALPPSLKVVAVTQTGGTLDRATHRASIPTLAAGSEAVFTIRVRATQVGTYHLSAVVQGTDPEDQVKNNRTAVAFTVGMPTAAAPASAILSSAFHR